MTDSTTTEGDGPTRVSPVVGAAVLDVLLVAAVGWAFATGRREVGYAVAGGGLILLVWQGALWGMHLRSGRPLLAEGRIRFPHTFQTFVQAAHFVYWGLFYTLVFDQIPFIAIQLVFAYLIEMQLCWSRRRTWFVGFGPVPVIGSLNLFLWFLPQYFWGQLLMVAVTFFGKEYIHWQREGRSTHIFNPSAFALSVAGLALMLTGKIGLTSGMNLTISYEFPPNFFEFMFAFGLIVQLLFHTTQVTLAAVVALVVLFFGSDWLLGAPLSPGIFHINVFLGINLLATDPSTSPRSVTGKLLFGFVWGVGILATYDLLCLLGGATYFDKILPVLAVNLLVPAFERGGKRIDAFFASRLLEPLVQNRFVHMAIYAVRFVAILPHLKSEPQGPGFVICAPSKDGRSPQTEFFLDNKRAFLAKHPAAGRPWGVLAEALHYADYHGAIFAGSWVARTNRGSERVQIRVHSGAAQVEFLDRGIRLDGSLTADGTALIGTWTPNDLPAALLPTSRRPVRARLQRVDSLTESEHHARRCRFVIRDGEAGQPKRWAIGYPGLMPELETPHLQAE